MNPKTKASLEKKCEERADFRSRCQCSSGDENLDKAISRYLKIGFEDGAQFAIPLAYAAGIRAVIEALRDWQKPGEMVPLCQPLAWVEHLEERFNAELGEG